LCFCVKFFFFLKFGKRGRLNQLTFLALYWGFRRFFFFFFEFILRKNQREQYTSRLYR